MIGARLWVAGTADGSLDEDSLVLSSINKDFIWSESTMGKPLSVLVDRDREGTAGYRLSSRTYLSQDDVSDMLPDFDSTDPRWFDGDFWHQSYPDCLVWDWIAQDDKICEYYGFYSYKTIDIMNGDTWIDECWPTLCGIVSGYGKIHKHTLGFRSEYMSILGFFINPEDAEDTMNVKNYSMNPTSKKSEDNITLEEFANIISKKMRVPLLSIEEAHQMEYSFATV